MTDSQSFDSFQCHGIVYGLIGIFQNDKLLLIKQRQLIGDLPLNHNVFKIQRIVVLSLTSNEPIAELSLDVKTFSLISYLFLFKIFFFSLNID